MRSQLRTRIERRLRRMASRGKKYVRQRLSGPVGTAAPLFLIGCQRSGTNMMMKILDASPETWTYNEDNPRAFEDYRIRSRDTIDALTARARCRWVVFKPLCDTQNIDRLMAAHPQAHAVWMYRDYKDVSNSALHAWGERQLWMIRNAATDPHWNHWLVERISPSDKSLLTDLYDETMSHHSAAALKWYVRNRILFDYGLPDDAERVHIVKYEELVTNPEPTCRALFDELGMEFSPSFIEHVTASSIAKNDFPAIAPTIAELCETMAADLDRALAAHRARRRRE